MKGLCGADCDACVMKTVCCGCDCPFGEKCGLADLCRQGGGALEQYKQKLMDAFNALHLPDAELVTELYPLRGSFINLEYTLPSGQKIKFWNDYKIYLGTQFPKQNTERCYGLAADEHFLVVGTYGECGKDPELVAVKRWN